MSLLRVRWVDGPMPRCRVYFCRRRVHHGLIGAATVAAGVAIIPELPVVGVSLIGVGVLLCHHDRSDFPWVRDR